MAGLIDVMQAFCPNRQWNDRMHTSIASPRLEALGPAGRDGDRKAEMWIGSFPDRAKKQAKKCEVEHAPA